jgi:hypothetical protein
MSTVPALSELSASDKRPELSVSCQWSCWRVATCKPHCKDEECRNPKQTTEQLLPTSHRKGVSGISKVKCTGVGSIFIPLGASNALETKQFPVSPSDRPTNDTTSSRAAHFFYNARRLDVFQSTKE